MSINAPTGCGFYYCSVSTFFNIITKHQIWLSDVLKMNDAKETSWAADEINKATSGFPTATKEVVSRALSVGREGKSSFYASCFSKDGDMVSQWLTYGGRGTGLSICFDLKKLQAIDRDHLSIEKIRYVKFGMEGDEGNLAIRNELTNGYITQLKFDLINSVSVNSRLLPASGARLQFRSDDGSVEDSFLAFTQNMFSYAKVVTHNINYVRHANDETTDVTLSNVQDAIDHSIPLLEKGDFERASNTICHLVNTETDSEIKSTIRGFYLLCGYNTKISSGTSHKRAVQDYCRMVDGLEPCNVDTSGNGYLCFKLSHSSSEDFAKLALSNEELFERAARLTNSHELTSIKDIGYESEKEVRLLLTVDERPLCDTIQCAFRPSGSMIIRYYKLDFPQEAIRAIVFGPNCNISGEDLDDLLLFNGLEPIGHKHLYKSQTMLRV